jgi:hypothetical protein
MPFLAQDREVAVIRQVHKVGCGFTALDFHLIARLEFFAYRAGSMLVLVQCGILAHFVGAFFPIDGGRFTAPIFWASGTTSMFIA